MFSTGMLSRGRNGVKTGSRRAGRFLPWCAALVWISGIFYLSHQTFPGGVDATSSAANVAHLALFGTLAVLLYWALASSTDRRTPAWLIGAMTFAIAVLYGVADEIHQAFVPGRTASESDLVFDAVGAIAGVAVAIIATRLYRARLGVR